VKVLVISHMYPSTSSQVLGLFVHQQVKELQNQGCAVKVICPTQWAPFPIKYLSKEWKGYSDIPARQNREGIDVYYPRYLVFPKAFLFSSSGKRMYKGIRELVGTLYKDFQFDVIHAHVALPDGFAAMMLNKRYNKPLVVTVHGADLYASIYINASCRKAIAKVFEEADKVVLVSAKLKEIAEASIGFTEKLIVISNGIDPQDISLGESTLASKYVGHRVILSVSSLIKRKGIGVNLRAISRLRSKYPNLKYLVIGDGPESSLLRQLTRDLDLDCQVEILGELPHKLVMDYMALADIFSLPSWNESFGMVYIEAAMHAKPVIACEGEGISDIFENNKTAIFVKPKNVESLVEGMDFLLGNPEKARELGERAKKLVLENYTWEKNARKYIEIYRELIASHG